MGLSSAAAGAAARSSSSLLSVVAVGVGVMRPVFIPSEHTCTPPTAELLTLADSDCTL